MAASVRMVAVQSALGCLALACGALLAFPLSASHAAAKLRIVAAENFYGDVARQIGGDDVEVTSILSNPDADPHLFETSVSIAKAIASAEIVIYNGADYDPWMAKLLSASPRAQRTIIVAAELRGAKPGDNPHLWYDPATLPAVAHGLATALQKRDPSNGVAYRTNLVRFDTTFRPVVAAIEGIAQDHKGTSVTASEPVYGYMANALGFTMLNSGFQTAVMNNTEPSASQVAAFEHSLKSHKVRILFYNKQVVDKSAEHLLEVARAAHIPVVGVTETMPAGMKVQDWFAGQLKEVQTALSGRTM